MAVDPACMSPEEMAELQPPKEVKLISWNEAQAEHAVDVWITEKSHGNTVKRLFYLRKQRCLAWDAEKVKVITR